MKKLAVILATITTVIFGVGDKVWSRDNDARDIDTGKSEYLSSCATCHGVDGKGDGPLSDHLKTRPADLTTLAQRNNGFLPLNDVYEIIDGRN